MSNKLITVAELMADLNLDDIGNTTKTISRLLNEATATIRMAIGSNIIDDQILATDADVYNVLIESIVNDLYFNKSFDNGFTHGQKIWLKNLKYAVLERLAVDDEEQTDVSTK